MFINLFCEWAFKDFKTRIHVKVPRGRHEVERIVREIKTFNSDGTPSGIIKVNWIVLKGTTIGAPENSMRDWGPRYGDKQIIFEEDAAFVV